MDAAEATSPTASSEVHHGESLTRWIDKLEATSDTSSDSTLSAGPRPTYEDDEVRIAHDRAEVSVEAGRYQLVVRCAGDGPMVAGLTVGPYGNMSDFDCSPEIAVTQVELEVPETSEQIDIWVTPVGQTVGAFDYVLTKLV